LCGGKAFVSQYELSFLLILDQYTGDQVGTVDISSFGDSDGRTESSSLVCFEERLYVGLEGLNRDLGFSYSESSIISIDPILEEVVSNWNIGNGIQMIADPFREGLLVSSAEWEGYPAGVYRFFPEDGDWEPISTLGQTPSRMAGDNNRLVYIAPSEGYEQYQVFCHDWEASETVEGDYFSEFLTDIQLDSTGIAWIGAHWGWNDIENAEAGLHRIDSSCQRGEHISTLLAPFRFVLATLPEESL
jgi:hypothetical protein